MDPVQFSDALRLTGLKESQLREWCGKRNLYRPTVPARGSGRMALFTWQDLIALRVFGEIKADFGGNAAQWSEGIAKLRQRLERQFFPGLWGKAVLFRGRSNVTLGAMTDALGLQSSLIIPLDPHLATIAGHSSTEDVQGELPLVTKIGPSR